MFHLQILEETSIAKTVQAAKIYSLPVNHFFICTLQLIDSKHIQICFAVFFTLILTITNKPLKTDLLRALRLLI